MSNTAPKLGLRARYKELEKFCNTLKVNSENATLVANAFFWHTGMKNRAQIKEIVDAYMAHMEGEVSKAKENGSMQVMEGFVDPAILAKVAEHEDSSYTDSE